MARLESLEGGCSCGRNKYVVVIPEHTTEVAEVSFDYDQHHRRSQATPLSAWLRVPLEWYRSSTYAFLDDETHASIRRTYTSPHEQSSKRHFCGFCGTPLSYWTESPPEEAEYISLTLGTLSGEQLRNLEELGILPEGALAEEEARGQQEVTEEEESGVVGPLLEVKGHQGLPWFDTMVEGSRLGKMRKMAGSKRSRDGNVKVEWEIVEWTADDEEEEEGDDTPPTAKRKLEDLLEDADSTMTGSR